MADIELNNKIDEVELSDMSVPPDLKKSNLNQSQNNSNTMNWIIDRLQERSTWRGIITGLTGLGVVTLGEELRAAVITAGVSLFALVEILIEDGDGSSK